MHNAQHRANKYEKAVFLLGDLLQEISFNHCRVVRVSTVFFGTECYPENQGLH